MVGISPFIFGPVHGKIGPLDQLIYLFSMIRKEGNPNTGGDIHSTSFQLKGAADG